MCVQKCYSDWLCPKRAYAIRRLEEFKRAHPLFRTLLHVCEKKDALRYETGLYPVYLMVGQYMRTFPQLKYIRVEYRI